MIKCVSLLFVLLFLGNGLARSAEVQKSFSEIFSASIAAMGGSEEVAKVQSITALADCLGPRGKYKTEIYSALGNRLKFRQVYPDGNSFVGFINGEHAWMQNEKSGSMTRLDHALAAGIRAHEFQMIPLVLPERIKNPTVSGEEDFAGEPCIKVIALTEYGKPCQIFFHLRYSLLAGMIEPDSRSSSGQTVRVVLNEWRQVGNLKLPSKVTATDKSGDWVLDFYDIRLNDVGENLFAVPPSILSTKESTQQN